MSPGLAPLLRSALNVVTPAHISGAASTAESSAGMAAKASAGTTMASAKPPELRHARNLQLWTVDEVALTARRTPLAGSAEPSHAHPLAQLPATG
jgi:hypothetical protein